MPGTDEDIMRGLMTSATADLFASPAATAAALKQQRQQRVRSRLLGAAGTAAAAGVAAGAIVATSSGSHTVSPAATVTLSPGGSGGQGTVTTRLTAAQTTLYGLSSAAAKAHRAAGRYVVMSEKSVNTDPGADGGSEIGPKTSVIDTVTGGGVEYQDITVTGEDGQPQPPAQATAAAGSSPTVAQLDAMPTGTAALRSFLLNQAKQQFEQAEQEQLKAQQQARKKVLPKALKQQVPTDDDFVFEQATDLLWEPDLSPALRSALYKVLAGTSGVAVNANATDSSGRAAVEISRVDVVGGTDVQTFENPANGVTLESAWKYSDGSFGEDLYRSISYTDTIPGDPYQG